MGASIKVSEFLGELVSVDVVRLDGKALLPEAISLAEAVGEAENQVARFSWMDEEGQACSMILTEENLEEAVFDTGSNLYYLSDHEGTPATLYLGRIVPAVRGSVYAVIQEGGSSTELYLHLLDTAEEAEEYRVECEEEGSYRTSDVVELPASLANRPDFHQHVANLVQATLTVDYPSN
ncbi:peptidoglycan lytic exotransglycosylase [Novimethylophilus kurashikiensis]|uniref:Peptidoglycan lytic exotransglycosylase n=1 Tax=Novimethylophilus kurashikiensis TaxID=1825523 RepID=A0A2R5F8C2_9PROT|nr:hypothetical protein [Novimethylophilus kurashikiensis]GBG14492.1 peptidoglycan lytic exotransglycosylase [Novimethylophilus kurashikiensis]